MDYDRDALEELSQIGSYNKWLVAHFRNYIGEKVLEIGSGIGNITQILLCESPSVTPSDIRKDFISTLNNRFNNSAFYLDIAHVDFNKIKQGSYDTVVAFNVIEHIHNEDLTLKNMHRLLSPEGRILIVMPAHDYLFGSYDKLAGHKRRYSVRYLKRILSENRFVVEKIRYINKLGAIGWWVNSKVLRRIRFPENQLAAINFLVPFLNILDKIIPGNFGLSIICVGKKAGQECAG